MSRRIYSGTVLVLGAVQLIESIAVGLPLSFFPNYAIGLGATLASVGVFTSSFMLSSAIMAPRMGNLSDRYGRKRIMLLGIIGDIVFGFATGLVPSWEWLLVVRLINGAVSGAAMLSAEALLMDSVEPDVRGEASGFIMSSAMIGRNIGPLLGGVIQWQSNTTFGLSLIDSYRIPYFVDAGFAVLAFAMVYVFVREPFTAAHREAYSRREEDGFELTGSIKVLLVNGFISGIGVGFIMPIMVLFYNDKFGMNAVEIGLILSISGFVGLAASWIAGRVADRMGRKPLIALGSYLSQLFAFILPFTGDPTQAGVAMSARSMGFNINHPAFQALRADVVPPRFRGRAFGLFISAFTAGDVVGPIVSTWLYDIYRLQTFNIAGLAVPGLGIPFFVNGILGVIGTTMVMFFVREPRPEERSRRIDIEPMEEI